MSPWVISDEDLNHRANGVVKPLSPLNLCPFEHLPSLP